MAVAARGATVAVATRAATMAVAKEAVRVPAALEAVTMAVAKEAVRVAAAQEAIVVASSAATTEGLEAMMAESTGTGVKSHNNVHHSKSDQDPRTGAYCPWPRPA